MNDFFLDENLRSVHSSQYVIAAKPGDTVQLPGSSAAPAPKPAEPHAPTGSGEIAKVMNSIKGVITEDVVKKTQAIFTFDIKGKILQNQ